MRKAIALLVLAGACTKTPPPSQRNSDATVAIEAHAPGTMKNHFAGSEMIRDGGVSGDISLDVSAVMSSARDA